MPLPSLDNLVRIGKLKTEPPAKAEFDGLLRVAQEVLQRVAGPGPIAEGKR
jgi:hypothetical protein